MKIRILGCHGSNHLLKDGGKIQECRACAFLIEDSLLLDAGTVGAALSHPEQQRLRHVLVSHLHFDHIQGLPTLADTLFDQSARPLTVHSIAPVLKGLQSYIFNGEVYPDFTRLPDPDRPVFRPSPLEPGRPVQLERFRVTAVPVNHQVPAVGFIVEDERSAIVVSGDTYATEEIWKLAGRMPNLKAAFIECSFPDGMAEDARISKHLTPSLFIKEFQKLDRPDLQVYAYHLKPRYRDTLKNELVRLGIPHLALLEEGQELLL